MACPECDELCEQLASYFGNGHTLFTRREIQICLPPKCSICVFLWSACNRDIISRPSRDSTATIETHADNHGTVYIRNTSLHANARVYLLPLEASPASISGRLLRSQCNFGLISTWLKCCHDWHGPNCYTPGWDDRITPLSEINVRVIDVIGWCLVRAPVGCRYVALSYVWGKAPTLQLTRANLARFEMAHGLEMVRDQVPQTILDAIELVRKIGERYLWVDSLCIVQDDAEEKHGQVANMDAVYGGATLTINAAAGKDSQAGLAGVRADSRNVTQLVLEYKPGQSIIAAQPVMTEIADQSHWNTRAWTYQERFLSKRSLTFTDQQAFFQCQRMIWCEDTAAESPDITDYYQMEDYLPIEWSSTSNEHMYKLHYALHVSRSVNWVEYLRVVEEYTPRQLTFDCDVLAAFAGMAKVLSSMFRSPLLYGLPESLFHCALLWQPGGNLSRRISSGTGSSNEHFPTWSWAGWKGPIVYEDIMPHLKMLSSELIRRTKPLVKWYKQTSDGSSSMPVATVGDAGKYLLKPFAEALPDGWHEADGGMFDIFIGTYYYHADSPSSFFAIATAPVARGKRPDAQDWPRIMGTLSSAMLKITAEDKSTKETPSRFSIIAGETWYGSVCLSEDWIGRTEQEHEFVVLSEGSTPKAEVERFWSEEKWTEMDEGDGTTWYKFYNVLLIERKGSTATRAGIGKIDKARWDLLPSRLSDVCLE